ncbi:hypothetical protein BDV96DRAFT_592494 [Lophiotrema nucula]|uniref:DUF1907 domain-containing protein n=1 Tax=Lophiotrema nucula TaxID=690887 RepID=A0A6A5YET9_9PLEO|nr:hypothetical protein BDV96DRAFT_592494 [Lophiotrema nucula]
MQIERLPLTITPLSDVATGLRPALSKNYATSSVEVVTCPDLRSTPFYLATQGLSGDEKVADVGGQPNLFPNPRLERKWDMLELARGMEMDIDRVDARGGLIGAGAGPCHAVGRNCELVPNLSFYQPRDGELEVDNKTCVAQIKDGMPRVEKSPSRECALMVNLFGSRGDPGPVLKITAKKRIGKEKSFTECIRRGLVEAFGDERMISLGGAFVVRSGICHYHIMPDFPPQSKGQDYTWTTAKELNDWLTYHDFSAKEVGPIVCLSVLHSADPEKLGLRMEHTHCASMEGKAAGGHYHGDVEGEEEVEYEGYFNTAKTMYRIDRPEVTLERDLHE